MDKYTACVMASGKTFACANNWHIMAYGAAHVFGCSYAFRERDANFRPFPPASFRAKIRSKPLLDVRLRGRRSGVIIRTLVVESNIFSDQCYELLCFVILLI